jgi:transcriptional regulator with XRE-family HTH domain
MNGDNNTTSPASKLPRFGAFLKEARAGRSIAVISAATDRQVKESSLSHWEAGRTGGFDSETLKNLATAYNVDALKLLWRLVQEKYIDGLGVSEARKALLESAFLATNPTNGLERFPDAVAQAKAKLIREVNIIDVPGIVTITDTLTDLKECWVVADDFAEDENAALLAATVKRMTSDGTKFVYFLPSTKISKFKRLKYDVQLPKLGTINIEEHVQGFVLGDGTVPWMFSDYSIFNPSNTPPDFGFQFRRKAGKPDLGWQLDPVTLMDITSILAEWKRKHSPIEKDS